MWHRSKLLKVVAVVLATLLPGALCAETVPVPHGTRVFLGL